MLFLSALQCLRECEIPDRAFSPLRFHWSVNALHNKSLSSIMSWAANKPITSFKWYQVFLGFYWLCCDCKGNHFSQPNTIFINPGHRCHYFAFQNKDMLVTHISKKLKFQKRFPVLRSGDERAYERARRRLEVDFHHLSPLGLA